MDPITDIVHKFDSIDERSMSTRYADFKLEFTDTARVQFEYGFALEGNKSGEYHTLARLLPSLKLDPYKPVNGSPARGKVHNYKGRSKYNKYDIYHAGGRAKNLRAYYVVTENHKILIVGIGSHEKMD